MKRYIGDGVYVDFDGWALVLTTENGLYATNRIVLEPEVYGGLVEYVASLKQPAPQAPPAVNSMDNPEEAGAGPRAPDRGET